MTIKESYKTIKEEYDLIRKGSDTVPSTFHITKEAENDICFFARQMNCSEDEALDMLLYYCTLTDNCIKILEDLGYTFDPSKAV